MSGLWATRGYPTVLLPMGIRLASRPVRMSTLVPEGVESGARLIDSLDSCWERPRRACRMPERGTTGTFNRKRTLHKALDREFASRASSAPAKC